MPFIRSIGLVRRKQLAEYSKARKIYLAAHPFCQIAIAHHRLREAEVIRADGAWLDEEGRMQQIPRATEIHHRNRRNGVRLTDERWWMAAANMNHRLVEANPAWAREEGYLLPVNADAEGRFGGNQALTTPQLMACRARRR